MKNKMYTSSNTDEKILKVEFAYLGYKRRGII